MATMSDLFDAGQSERADARSSKESEGDTNTQDTGCMKLQEVETTTRTQHVCALHCISNGMDWWVERGRERE